MPERLTDEAPNARGRPAEHEGPTSNDGAAYDAEERRSEQDVLDQVLDEELPRYAETFRRLGE